MSFLPGTGTLAVIFTAVPIGLVAAFIAMNPAGFLAMLAAGGAFIVASLVGLVNAGFAGIYYVGQVIIVSIANLLLGFVMTIITGLNGIAHAILTFLHNAPLIGALIDPSKFPYMPMPSYLPLPNVPGTFKDVVGTIQNSFNTVAEAYTGYWSGVQASAPGSYTLGGLSGVGAGGITWLAYSKETPEGQRLASRVAVENSQGKSVVKAAYNSSNTTLQMKNPVTGKYITVSPGSYVYIYKNGTYKIEKGGAQTASI